jgi:hypothetical protein
MRWKIVLEGTDEFGLALSDQRQLSVGDIAYPDPSGYQVMSARHSPSAAERLRL